MGVEKLKETLAPNMSRKDELELESATGLFFRKDNHDAEDAHSPFGIDNLAGGLSTRTQDTRHQYKKACVDNNCHSATSFAQLNSQNKRINMRILVS